MGLPNINIEFKSTAITAITRGERGVVAMILLDSSNNGLKEIQSSTDIPSDLSTANKEQISLALIGSVKPPKKVVVYVLPEDATDYSAAFTAFETVTFDYLVAPASQTTALTSAVATWVKNCRDNLLKKIKAVLPGSASDHEGIINFNTDNIKVGATTYSAKEYCARIAGMLAGCPLTISATFQALPEVTDVPRLTKSQLDTAINAGQLVLYYGMNGVQIARAVNSLVTTTQSKGESFKKIKIVDIIDLINDDIRRTAEKSFIGKYANSYNNKCLLISAINGYFDSLVADGLLDSDADNKVAIDAEAQRIYLTSIGTDVSSMKLQEIIKANTADKVYLAATLKPLDAMEEITLSVTI